MSLSGPPYMGLCRERAATIESIQRMMTDVNDVNIELTAPQMAVRLEILDGYWIRFQDVQHRLLMEFSNIEAVNESMSQIEQDTQRMYADAKAALLQRQLQLPAKEPMRRAPRACEIKVPAFSGKYTEWAAWRSEFKAKVLDARLDVADKITLLLGALTNEAATCAGRAERLDEVELDRIWKKLDRTYDNKYQQVYAHIAEIITIAPIGKPSAGKLRSMIDIVDQHLRMLKRFDIDTDHWSPIVCVLLLGKLDTETRNQWESKDSLPAMPDLNALFTYLEQRILAIRNVEMSEKRVQTVSSSTTQGNASKSANATQQNNRFHPYEHKRNADSSKANAETRAINASNAPVCVQCDDGTQHYLWQCDAFKQLQSADKLKKLAQWGICEVCITAKHKANECTKGICPICKEGKHNSLVCPQKPAPKKVNHVRRRTKVRNASTTD